MGRKVIYNEGKTFSIMANKSDVDRIDHICDQQNISRTEWYRQAMLLKFAYDKKKEKINNEKLRR